MEKINRLIINEVRTPYAHPLKDLCGNVCASWNDNEQAEKTIVGEDISNVVTKATDGALYFDAVIKLIAIDSPLLKGMLSTWESFLRIALHEGAKNSISSLESNPADANTQTRIETLKEFQKQLVLKKEPAASR